MATQMCLWHIVMAEQPYVRLPLLRQMVLEHCQCHICVCAPPPTEIYGMSVSISLTRHLLLSGGAVRRNSLRCAPFGPPTVSASSLPLELVSGRHLPLPEAVGWPRPPYRTTCQTTCRLRPLTLENGVRKRHYLPRFRKFEQAV